MTLILHENAAKAGRRQAAPGSILIRTDVPFDAPWAWLGAGWRDLWRTPVLSLGYGATFSIAALVLIVGLFSIGWQSLMLVLAGGFLLVGPMLAVGLYEISRRLEAGQPIDARDALFVGVRSPGQLAIMGVVLLIAYLAWVEIALVLFVLFLGGGGLPPPEEFVTTLLFTPRGLGLLVTGTVVGGLLAATVYSLSALSIPLLMSRDIDVVTAVSTSVQAVIANPKPMLLWAALVAAMCAVGIASLLVGFIVAFPLIGHATWHAFRAVVHVEEEPEIVPDVTTR
ncbi:MAG: DUF2189 domain-containing protein [Hyphomicrobiaceae bacterium]